MIGFLWFGSQAMANPVTNWLQSEKEKTIAYQQKSWESAKEQTANTKEQLINQAETENVWKNTLTFAHHNVANSCWDSLN